MDITLLPERSALTKLSYIPKWPLIKRAARCSFACGGERDAVSRVLVRFVLGV